MLKVLLSVSILCAFSFGADKETTYVFKAKGEFAKELKQLMKKHEKDGKVEIYEEKPDYYNAPRYKQRTVVDSILGNEEIYGNIRYGERLYDKTCYRCHGKKADKSSYPSARVLNTLTKDQLFDAMRAYKTDSDYGGFAKFVMREQAIPLSDDDMASLATYIYSLSHSKKEAMAPVNSTEEDMEESRKQGVQGTYLK